MGLMWSFSSSGNTFYSNVIKNSSHGIDSQDPTLNNSNVTLIMNADILFLFE